MLLRLSAPPLAALIVAPLAGGSVAADQLSPVAKDLQVQVSKGDYFSSTYKVNITDRQDEWDTQWLRIKGGGVSQRWRKASVTTRLKPGKYKVVWRTKVGWPGLARLAKEGRATITFEGETRVTRTEPREYWSPDATADPDKGLAYWSDPSEGVAVDNTRFGPKALERGATYLGKILCLEYDSYTKDYYYINKNSSGSRVIVSPTDSRVYTPEPSKGWEPTILYVNGEDTGGWTVNPSDIGNPCTLPTLFKDPARTLAFRVGQEPQDAFVGSWNPRLNVYALPDGNMVKRTERVPVDGTWSGVVTAEDDRGNLFKGKALANSLAPNINNVRVSSVRLTKRGTEPALRPRTSSANFTVRARNNRCATGREGKAIRLGMTLGQVRNIIGSRGYLDVRGAVTVRSWLGCGPGVTIGFVGGRVASIVY